MRRSCYVADKFSIITRAPIDKFAITSVRESEPTEYICVRTLKTVQSSSAISRRECWSYAGWTRLF